MSLHQANKEKGKTSVFRYHGGLRVILWMLMNCK